MGCVPKKIRTRFAPSPTGYLHIGNARTALFSWLFAAHYKGSFILRIEDTDMERSAKIFEDSILNDLRWLGLDWDEGFDKGGAFGPYRQSERFNIYEEYADRLIASGNAYHCYCSHDRLEQLKKGQIKAGWPSKYDGRCRTLSKEERPADIKPVIRFKNTEKIVTFEDEVHKKLSFDTAQFGDFIIVGSDGIAAYNFAVVIDDALMGITHVIRGEDHLSNTPKQILIFDALNFSIPKYVHIPLILGQDRTPLSKRHGNASVKDLKEAGFVPEAVINHLCHLGFSPIKEFISSDEAIELFSLERLSKSPSIFDIERLKVFNRAYIEKIDIVNLVSIVKPYCGELLNLLRTNFKSVPTDGWFKKAVEAARGEANTLQDISAILLPILKKPDPDEEVKKILKEPPATTILNCLKMEIEKESDVISSDNYKEIMKRVKEGTRENGKRLFMPIRAALTGMVKGIELEKIFVLLGKEEMLKRIGEVG